jgi:hypothetical protein
MIQQANTQEGLTLNPQNRNPKSTARLNNIPLGTVRDMNPLLSLHAEAVTYRGPPERSTDKHFLGPKFEGFTIGSWESLESETLTWSGTGHSRPALENVCCRREGYRDFSSWFRIFAR